MILGLDLGQNIGWVLGDRVGPLRRGTFVLAQTSKLGPWLHSSDEFFRAVFRAGVTGIAVEQPFMGRDYYPARKLISLLGHVYYWSGFYNIHPDSIAEVPVATGKKTLSGHGNADAEVMIAAAAERGYEGMDEHQAHALGIWWVYQFGAAETTKKGRPRSGKAKVIKPGEATDEV